MESLSQIQALVTENMHAVGLGLLVCVLLAGVAWYWMSRRHVKSDVLENKARVNAATLDSGSDSSVDPSVPMDVPSSAAGPEPHMADNQDHDGE